MTSLHVDLAPRRGAGLRLAHPITVAAGGAGYGVELLDAVEDDLPSAIVTRGTTLSARPGARGPRFVPQDDGLLHAIGRPNAGVGRVLDRFGGRWAAADIHLILSICADTAEGFGEIARAADGHAGVAALEVDLSCGDSTHGGRPFGIDVGPAESATVAARAATDLPIIVKLTPLAPDIREIARAVVAAGADAISAIASPPGLAMARTGTVPALGSSYGWRSGPGTRSAGLRVVYEIAQVVAVPIVGVGGVATLEDAIDYLAAGATAVGMATAALADPTSPGRIARQLERWCRSRDIEDIDRLVGAARPSRRDRGSLRTAPDRI